MNKQKSTPSRSSKPFKRDKQAVRFLKWIGQYPGWWYLICTPSDEHMTMDMMKMLIMRLNKERFYEIIFVLLTVHRDAGFMDSVFKTMLLNMIRTGWKAGRKKQIICDLIDLLT